MFQKLINNTGNFVKKIMKVLFYYTDAGVKAANSDAYFLGNFLDP